MKKLLLFLTLCAVLTSCSSAGTKPESSSDAQQENSISADGEKPTDIGSPEELKSELMQLTNCYKKESLPLPDNIASISDSYKLDGGNIMLYTDNIDYKDSCYYKTDADFSTFERFEYEQPEEMQNYDSSYDHLFFNLDGTACSLVTLEDHGGLVLPDEWDENFDYESYNNNCITTNIICTYDSNGKLLTKTAFEYPEELYDDYGYVLMGRAMADGDSLLIPFEDGSIRRLSADGTFTTIYEIANPNDYVYTQSASLSLDRDNKIIVMMKETTETDDSDGMTSIETVVNFHELTDNGISEDVIYSCTNSDLMSSIIFGRGDYRFFIPTNDGLVGVKDDGTADVVIDWLASSLEPMYYILPCGETDFIGTEWNSDQQVMKFTPRDMSELADVEIITVANCDTMIMNDFNNSNDKYRVQLIEYSYEDRQQLNMDIISGNAPDVICGLDYSTYLNYCKKGVFADLYDFMDDELNKDMVMPNVITAMERDGSLYSLCTSFYINTLVAKTRVCDKENWTFQDMLTLYDNSTAEHLYDSTTKLFMFERMFYTMNDLIDYENSTCNFNTPEFVQLLEFCNRFVDTVDEPDKWTDTTAWEQYNTDKYHWLGNDQIVVTPLNFTNLSQYNLVKYRESNGEDLTLVGYPSDNGKGGRIVPEGLMSITENCENKQGAWEFLKFYVLNQNKVDVENYQYSNMNYIPVLTESFNQAMTAEISAKHSANGESYPSYTQADVDMLTDYIISCDTIGTVTDNDIRAVCDEEAGMYFSGEQTAEQSAEFIQNRVSVLLSEKS